MIGHEITGNKILDSLHASEREWMLPQMEIVTLPSARILCPPFVVPRYGHFPLTGIASLVTLLQSGEVVEAGIVGSDGLVEAIHLLGSAKFPSQIVMQIEGKALRIPFSALFRAFCTLDSLHRLVLQQVQEQVSVLAQLTACNRLHGVEQRLARWLLMVQDRLRRPTFSITQEFLAEMIGVRRPTVTLVVGRLQREHVIECGRGQVRIVDREGLERLTCECYSVVRDIITPPEDAKAE